MGSAWAQDQEAPPAEKAPDTSVGEANAPPDSAPAQDEFPEDAFPEAESADAASTGDGSDPARAPTAGKGVIWGVVTDTRFNEPLIEAPVNVLDQEAHTLTDTRGRYRLELAPGTYSLRVQYDLHKALRVDGIEIAAGQVQKVDAELTPDEGAMDTFEIVARTDKTSLEGIILARKKSTIVGDSIGRSEVAKSTDRNAAQAAQRVVGATVVGNRFVYVRGLGERYTNALLNGVPLPSPEPDRQAVPLDLFPTGVLDSLTIAKTFTPDVPGDFAGGSVRIETREIPSKPLFNISIRGAYNTQSTFRERLTYSGGDLDWLGLDDGTRALPDSIPDYKLISGASKPDGTTVTEGDVDQHGRTLNRFMTTEKSTTPPDHSVSITAGNGWNLGGEKKLGFVVTLGWGRSYAVHRDTIIRLFDGNAADPRGWAPYRDYRLTSGNEKVGWGGFGSLTYQFSQRHRIGLTWLRTTLSDNIGSHLTGRHRERDADIFALRRGFLTRSLTTGILSGQHSFPSLNGALLDWNFVLSEASLDEPRRRDTVWQRGRAQEHYVFSDVPESGRHFFADQSEAQKGVGVDWTQPLREAPLEAKLKLGGLLSLRDRDFLARTFRYRPERGTNRNEALRCDGDINACTDALFVPDNIGPLLYLEESTRPADSYNAELDVYAAYAMTELALSERVRLVLGERIEHTYQTIEPFDQFGVEKPPEGAKINRTDLLPAVAATWDVTKKSKLRASVTRTLARPQLRELAPFLFRPYFGGRMTGGNPDLELTRISNVDLRFEFFPSLREVLAFTLFYKHFKDPIEPVVLAGGEEGSVTFRNTNGADLIGLELEARLGLDFASEALKNLSLVTNLTLAQSRIQLADELALALTNRSRPLLFQAPWVYNLALDFTDEDLGTNARLLYNVVGPTIVEVGVIGLPDVYQHPRNVLDLTFQQALSERIKAKLEIKNLLDAPVLWTQGCGGRGVFGSSWHLTCGNEDSAVLRYTDGVTIALSAGYGF